MSYPVIKAVTYVLAHAPHLVRYGSKPLRETAQNEAVLGHIEESLRDFNAARDYGPNQVYIGNLPPEALADLRRPWYANPVPGERFGPFGEIIPEVEFFGLMRIADSFGLFRLEAEFSHEAREQLRGHPLVRPEELAVLDSGLPSAQIEAMVAAGALPIYDESRRLVGAMRSAHEQDDTLTANVLLENLACKTSGAWALRHLARDGQGLQIDQVDYVLGCGEEAVGDRYQRGGGSLSKAMAEFAGFGMASGSDVKAFCAAPIHAVVLAASLVQSKIWRNVAVVGGGSLAKLGMKFRGHLKHQMPVLEDVLGAVAILVGPDDGESPVVRLDAVGLHRVSVSASPPAMMQVLVMEPLQKLGYTLLDVDKYSLELHNPEVTEPAGSGNVPLTNYRTLAGLAVMREEMERDEIDIFIARRGMPGFSPTQGHIAAAVPFLGHARQRLLTGEIERAMFVAKGSLFLGRMTNLSDGMSFLIERNT
ncbi:MAG: glycine/sarcosine/betaine reductase complex component C subunit beta [Ardenticatenaceae bacterium]|nr:glycine/sarcosine/betaine reductase complex component C subunit beta [Ardenticatenaceae bacterium]HBY98006.1 glycine reductase [Chloroflexota bacterium]